MVKEVDPLPELERSVRKWVETSGRSLELRTARTLRIDGSSAVAMSSAYVDEVTGAARELDVLSIFELGEFQGLKRQVLALVECKGNPSKPWVGFYQREAGLVDGLQGWATWWLSGRSDALEPLSSTWRGRPPFDHPEVASHIVTALGSDNGNNPANDALRQVLAASSAWRSSWIQDQNKADHPARVALAVVVTSAPLFQCELDEAGQVVLAETDRIDVWGWTADGAMRRVYVVHERAFPTFVGSLRDRCAETASNA